MSLRYTSQICGTWLQYTSRSCGSMGYVISSNIVPQQAHKLDHRHQLSTTSVRLANQKHAINRQAGDRIKSINSMKTRSAIFRAVNLGGPNPKSNPLLSKALDLGDSLNVPKKSMKRFLDNAQGKSFDEVIIPIRGGAGCLFVLTYTPLNKFNLTKAVRKLAGKSGGIMMDNTIITQQFYKKAIVEAQFSEPTSLEEAETIALECDVEEVTPVPDCDNAFKFFAEPDELQRMTEALSQQGLEIVSSEVEHLPFERIKLNDADRELWQKTLEQLANMDDELHSVFDNVEW